jgi:transposase
MRRGMNGLALQVQEALGRDPHAGDLYVFRGARSDLIRILWHDGLGISLYAKRLEKGRFISYGLCQRFRQTPPSANAWTAQEDGRCLHWSGRRVYVDGRSDSYAGVGYPMMTVRRRAFSLWPRTSAHALVQHKFEGSLYRARRPGRYRRRDEIDCFSRSPGWPFRSTT